MRRENTVYTNYPLPDKSPALAELDAYCDEWTKTRPEASKDIIIAWAKARRGDPAALLASIGLPGLIGAQPAAAAVEVAPAPVKETAAPRPTRPKPTNGNALAADLDL